MRQAREILASTSAVGEAEARSLEAEELARREAMEMYTSPFPRRSCKASKPFSKALHYPYMSFFPDHATVPMLVEPNRQYLCPLKRHNLWNNPALFEGAALGAPQLGGESPTAAQPASASSEDEHAWARDFDLFGPGPATVLLLQVVQSQTHHIPKSQRAKYPHFDC